MQLCRILRASLLTVLLSHAAMPLRGQSLTQSSHSLDAVTVTARRKTDNKILTIGGDSLSSLRGAISTFELADGLRRLPGISVRDYGGIGGMKTVSVHNMGAAHTAVSYDGIAVSNCQAGQIDIGRFSTNNLSQASLNYGQQNELMQSARLFASASTLALETRHPFFQPNHRFAGAAQLKIGSFGEVNPALQLGWKTGTRTILSVNGDYLRADGAYPFTIENGTKRTEEKRRNSTIHSERVEGNLWHTFADGGKLNAKAYYYNSKRGLPGAVILYNNEAHEKLWDENVFVQSQYEKAFGRAWTLLAQAKYNHSWSKYEDTDPRYVGGRQTDVHRQDEYYLSATAGYRPTENWAFSVAQDAAVNKLRNNLDDCPYPTRLSSYTALNVRYLLPKLRVTGTLVNTFVRDHVQTGDRPADRKRLCYNIGLKYQIFSDLDIYTNYKSTFRVPTFNDLYYLRMGNRNLRPEKAKEYTVGLAYNPTFHSNFVRYINIVADGYFNNVTDKIVAFPSTYVWRMANFGKVHTTGLDVSLLAGLKFSKDFSLDIRSAYTLQKAIDLTDKTAKNYKDQLPYTPRHNGSISLDLTNPWLNVNYTIVAVGKRYSRGQNLPEYLVKRYAEHTLSLWRYISLRKCKLRAQADLVNLTNKQYSIIQYYPMPGRAYKLTIGIEM